MSDLAKQKCVPCEKGAPPLRRDEVMRELSKLNGWMVHENMRVIESMFEFKNFVDALAFVNKVGAIAESEGHHPDISLSWGKVIIKLSTHSIKGLSMNDFILAAKIDEVEPN